MESLPVVEAGPSARIVELMHENEAYKQMVEQLQQSLALVMTQTAGKMCFFFKKNQAYISFCLLLFSSFSFFCRRSEAGNKASLAEAELKYESLKLASQEALTAAYEDAQAALQAVVQRCEAQTAAMLEAQREVAALTSRLQECEQHKYDENGGKEQGGGRGGGGE